MFSSHSLRICSMYVKNTYIYKCMYIQTHTCIGNNKQKKLDLSKLHFEWMKLLIQLVQSLSHVQLFATPWTAACQASLSITNSQSLLKLMSIQSVMPSNHLILCHPLPFLPSIFPSIRVFSNKSAFRIRWPKYWSFSFNISPSNEYSGLISFRMDWLDLLGIQGTLKILLQYHSSKASIIRHSAFFIVQLSHPCMTTGKTIALTRLLKEGTICKKKKKKKMIEKQSLI